MRPNAVRLEDSGGKAIENPSEDDVRGTVDRIGVSIDHCTLDLGQAGYVQAAGAPNALFVEYRDGTGMYSSPRADLDADAVGRIFVEAMNGRTEWKHEFAFESAGEAPGVRRAEEAGIGGMSGRIGRRGRYPRDRGSGTGGGSLGDELRRTVGTEARFGLRRIVRRIIRNLLRRR